MNKKYNIINKNVQHIGFYLTSVKSRVLNAQTAWSYDTGKQQMKLTFTPLFDKSKIQRIKH